MLLPRLGFCLRPGPERGNDVALLFVADDFEFHDGTRRLRADDLQKIEGIGPVLEKLLLELGIFHFDQIAAFGAAEVAWLDGNLKGFRGRATRDKWVAQAKLIGEVGMEEFQRRAKTNDY